MRFKLKGIPSTDLRLELEADRVDANLEADLSSPRYLECAFVAAGLLPCPDLLVLVKVLPTVFLNSPNRAFNPPGTTLVGVIVYSKFVGDPSRLI